MFRRDMLHDVCADDGIVLFCEILGIPQATDRENLVLNVVKKGVETIPGNIEALLIFDILPAV